MGAGDRLRCPDLGCVLRADGLCVQCLAVSTEDGTLLVDPPEPGQDGWLPVDPLEPFAGVWLTNRNPQPRRGGLPQPLRVDRVGSRGRRRPARGGRGRKDGGPHDDRGRHRDRAVPGKSQRDRVPPPTSGALIVGDLVIGVSPGELSTNPDEVIDDKAKLHRSAARLLDCEFDALLLCHGEPLPLSGRTSCGSRGAPRRLIRRAGRQFGACRSAHQA
jgi:hypothetical protein